MMKLLQVFTKWFKKATGQPDYKEKIDYKSEDVPISPQSTRDASIPPRFRRTEVKPSFIQKKTDKVTIQVGLDFGTSSTKIMYSQLGRPGVNLINLNHSLTNYPSYCLPSLAAINDKGILVLGVDAAKHLLNKEWDMGFQRFKMIIAGNHDKIFLDDVSQDKFNTYKQMHGLDETFTAERLTAIYLAHVMREARNIITNYPHYRDVDVNMSFNICMPIDHIQNRTIKEDFEKIFRWGERIEECWRAQDKKFDVLETSYKVEDSLKEESRVHVVPESVASFASYIISLQKQEGLYAVIDMGAGTTDVSICNLKSISHDEPIYWYAARNIPYGTIEIERIIAAKIKKKKEECTCHDVFSFLKNLSTNSGDVHEEILQQLKKFKNSKDYCKTWGIAYHDHLSRTSEWENVEIFLSGGGANLPPARDVFSDPWYNLVDNNGNKIKYRVSPLPTPDDFNDAGTGAPFVRLAVAYGLTIPIPMLNEYVLTNDSPNQTPIYPRRDLPDRDDLYPR